MSSASLADPFFLAHRALRKEIQRMAADASGLVLDVGCGTAPYRQLFDRTCYYVGIEVASRSRFGSAKLGANIFYDGQSLPLRDACVDNVLCSQVLEHVFDPLTFLAELHRVLRPGGRLMLTVPFVWDEHEQPYDFARYSSYGLRHLADKSGFETLTARRTLADASLFAQLWLAYWFKVVVRSGCASSPRKALIAGMSVAVNVVGLLLSKMLPASPDLYLDNAIILIRSEQTIAPSPTTCG